MKQCRSLLFGWIMTTITTTIVVRASWIRPLTTRQQRSFVPILDHSSFTKVVSASLDDYVKRMQDECHNVTILNEGRACPGEPSVDPSKVLQWNQGDSEWMEDW